MIDEFVIVDRDPNDNWDLPPLIPPKDPLYFPTDEKGRVMFNR